MPNSARLTGIKSLRSDTIPEAAEITGVSTRTIRTWIKAGLPVMAEERPTLIRSDDPFAFIKNQRAGRQTDVLLRQFFCLRCRTARNAAGGFAECRTNGTRITITAFCDTCETIMHKPLAKSRLLELRVMLDLVEPG